MSFAIWKATVRTVLPALVDFIKYLLRDIKELSDDMNENTRDLEEIRRKKAELLATA
jgi:hypothetical protein